MSGGGQVFEQDLFGRSLPLHRIGEAQPSSESDRARFVPQLNTEKVAASAGREISRSSKQTGAPLGFTISKGTSLMDASPRGDVDAVFSGSVSVTLLQTWPHSHPLSLLDRVMAESLREHEATGLPLWLAVGWQEGAGIGMSE